MKIQDLPLENRPREKAIRFGIDSLSDEELLALLIGSGIQGLSALEIASDLIKTYHSMYSLANANYFSLCKQKGLKKKKALNLLAVFEFHNRLNSPQYKMKTAVSGSAEIYARYQYLENFQQEVLCLVMLDTKKNIIKEKTLYKGTENQTPISTKEILTELLVGGAKYFYLIHNHPSGNFNPSNNDVLMTRYLDGKVLELGICMLDHIIISSNGYFSFNEKNEKSLYKENT